MEIGGKKEISLAFILTGIVLLLMIAFIAVSIPSTYSLHAYIGDSPSVKITFSWLNNFVYFSYTYAYGQKPKKEYRISRFAHHTKEEKTVPKSGFPFEEAAIPDRNANGPDIDEAIADAAVTNNTFAGKGTRSQSKPPREWRKFVLNTKFLFAFLRYIHRILCHSKIRNCEISGSVGLNKPHETGMLAGLLYALMITYISGLNFNYSEEDLRVCLVLSGRIVPAVCILYTFSFFFSEPVRPLLKYLYSHRKG